MGLRILTAETLLKIITMSFLQREQYMRKWGWQMKWLHNYQQRLTTSDLISQGSQSTTSRDLSQAGVWKDTRAPVINSWAGLSIGTQQISILWEIINWLPQNKHLQDRHTLRALQTLEWVVAPKLELIMVWGRLSVTPRVTINTLTSRPKFNHFLIHREVWLVRWDRDQM